MTDSRLTNEIVRYHLAPDGFGGITADPDSQNGPWVKWAVVGPEITQLRGNLSLVEARLSAAMQEIAGLKEANRQLQVHGQEIWAELKQLRRTSEPGVCTFPACGHRDVTECGPIEPAPPDYIVQCRCGWMGNVSALKSLPDFKRGCPQCSVEFVKIYASQVLPVKSEGSLRGPQGECPTGDYEQAGTDSASVGSGESPALSALKSEAAQMPRDKLGWICSICNSWNHPGNQLCEHRDHPLHHTSC